MKNNILLRITVFVCALCFTILFPDPTAALSPSKDFYNEGLEALQAGKWEQALQTWLDGYTHLRQEGKTDPRIGVAFIELATEKQSHPHYATSDDIYMWGFSRENPEFQDVIHAEARRIAWLQPFEIKRMWEADLEFDRNGFARRIYKFWLERDPRPLTEDNERLVEHWERVAHARKTYTANRRGVYDCDDRGTVYVKYGNPTQSRTGVFFRTGIPYEVWVYADIGNPESVTFFFSRKYGIKPFGLMNGLADFSYGYFPPVRGYSYWQMSDISPLFRKRIYEIWINPKSANHLANYYKYLDEEHPQYRYAWDDFSDYESQMGKIDMNTHPVRFLDDRNRPKLTLLAIPTVWLDPEDVRVDASGHIVPPDFRLNLALFVRNETLAEIERISDSLPGDSSDWAVFTLDHPEEKMYYTLASEAYLSDPQEKQATEGVYGLFAIGTSSVGTPPILSTDDHLLELSDLIVGISPPEGLNFINYPFPVVPADEVSVNDPLHIYLELYHLYLDETGQAKYTVEYGVTHLNPKGKKLKRNEQVSLAFTVTTAGRRVNEELHIDTSSLRPGAYELFVNVSDDLSNQKKSRTARFRIEE